MDLNVKAKTIRPLGKKKKGLYLWPESGQKVLTLYKTQKVTTMKEKFDELTLSKFKTHAIEIGQ